MLLQFKEIEKMLKLLTSEAYSSEIRWMISLCERAVQAGIKGNYPVASGIVLKSGELGFVATNESLYPRFFSSKHAEMITIDQQEDNSVFSEDLHLICTLEPCLMCTSRIALSKVKKVTYLTADSSGGGVTTGTAYPPDFEANLSRIKF